MPTDKFIKALTRREKMIQQLNPPIPLDTPKGSGWAHFIIDYGQEHDLQWVCFIDDTRECWTFLNKDIKIQANYTMHRESSNKENNLPWNY